MLKNAHQIYCSFIPFTQCDAEYQNLIVWFVCGRKQRNTI